MHETAPLDLVGALMEVALLAGALPGRIRRWVARRA